LACSWDLPEPIIKSHQKKNGCGPGLREHPDNRGYPFNISVTAEASDFMFGTQLGPGLEYFPNIGGFPSIFTQWLKLGTSNLLHSFGLPRPTTKPHPEKNWAWPWVREASIYLEFSFYISTTAALSCRR